MLIYRKRYWLTVCLACAEMGLFAEKSRERETPLPNILWLTFEDTSASEIGCYGNRDVRTPIIDELASKGIQYMNAWSAAPQSSPARSSLITGCYATTFAMDLHPVPQQTPRDIFFPQLLREAGYYCTNNDKTHYNTTHDHRACWDESSKTATYNSTKRKQNQPFFAVFNSVASHMGRVRTFHTDGRRNYAQEGIHTQNLKLPAHVPDLPQIRSDYAGHLEAVQDIDKWVGMFLADLKAKGLEENTIVFVFSDHGGCLPRGKGYAYESGLKIPLIVYLPDKWKHLAPANSRGEKNYSLINFTDFAPTLLCLAGVPVPSHYQGTPFLGANQPEKLKPLNFGFATNQLHHFMPARVVSDGRYKYMRSYIPYKPFALRNYYQWGMPSNQAWDSLYIHNRLENNVWEQPYLHHRHEMLFDLHNDPSELHDLSENPHYTNRLAFFREKLSSHIANTKDLGFFIPSFRRGINLYDEVHKRQYPLEQLHAMVELAANPSMEDMEKIRESLKSNDPNMRFWGAVAMAQLGISKQAITCPPELLSLLQDEDAYVAAEAAFACAYLGEPGKAMEKLTGQQDKEKIKIDYALLECISMDKHMRPYVLKYRDSLLRNATDLPHVNNEDPGLMARGILINIGVLKLDDLYKEQYDTGLKLNRGRRPVKPLP